MAARGPEGGSEPSLDERVRLYASRYPLAQQNRCVGIWTRVSHEGQVKGGYTRAKGSTLGYRTLALPRRRRPRPLRSSSAPASPSNQEISMPGTSP